MKNILLLILLFCTGITQATSQDFIKQIEAFDEEGAYDKVDSVYSLAIQQDDWSHPSLQSLELKLSYVICLNGQGKSEQSYPITVQASKELQQLKDQTTNREELKKIKKLECKITYEMAYGLWQGNNNQEAVEIVKKAIEQASILNMSDILSEAYNLEGAIYRRLFMLDKAINSYQQSLKIAEIRKDYRLASIIISNISILYNEIEETEKAVQISRKQFDYPVLDSLSMESRINRIVLLCNHGILLTNAHHLENARDTFLLAEQSINEQTPGGLKFYLYTQCGRIFRDLGSPKEGLQYYRKALSYREQSRNPHYQANFNYLYGYALLHDSNSPEQAYTYTTEAINFYRQNDSLNIMLPKSLLLLSEIEAKKNNPLLSAQLAHEAYEKELDLQKGKYHKRLASFEAELKMQEKDLEISQLNEKRAIEKATYQARIYTIIIILAIFILMSALLIIHMRKRRIAFRLKQTELEFKIREKESQSRLLASEMSKKMTEQYLKGLEDSNNRISKELHDGICNELLSIHMQINQSEQKQLSEQLTQIHENVRNLSHQLSTPQFEHISLYDMLLLYTEKLNLLGSPQISSYISPEVKSVILLPEKILEVYRIIQEAVSNTIKHAHAQHMYLTTSRQDGQIEIIFEDDGIGFNVTQVEENELESGLGLRSIKERIHQLQGTFQIESQPGKGTILHIQFPV